MNKAFRKLAFWQSLKLPRAVVITYKQPCYCLFCGARWIMIEEPRNKVAESCPVCGAFIGPPIINCRCTLRFDLMENPDEQ